MVTKENLKNNYNPEIASQSNNIGQKLFAYIANGKNINDRIREKFKKSLIFIGDEGQIYNPLTNTYVGIGQTAYTHTISYIEDAHEKIAALQKMLASSMVSAIYANWSKEDWQEAIPTDALGTTGDNGNYNVHGDISKKNLPTKIYATNEIVLKGHGDYDPTTRLAATREYAHITDNNLQEGDTEDNLTSKLYSNTYKKLSTTNVNYCKYINDNSTTQYTFVVNKSAGIGVLSSEGVEITEEGSNIKYKLTGQGSYIIFDVKPAFKKDENDTKFNTIVLDNSDHEIYNLTGANIEEDLSQRAFATSGITVSLQKGLNRYLYSYTFTNRNKIEGIGKPDDTDQYELKQNIYLTDDQYKSLQSDPRQDWYGEDIDPFTNTVEVILKKEFASQDPDGGTTDPCRGQIFFDGLQPVYDDSFKVLATSVPEYSEFNKSYISWIHYDEVTNVYTYGTTAWTAGGQPTIVDAEGSSTEATEDVKNGFFAQYAAINKKHQLFKQSANVMTIDDKLTWSYIASAYSYTLNFSKEYTDNQVNRIYRELLGEEELLIPVSPTQIKVAIPNDTAVLDKDNLKWNSDTKTWVSGEDDTYEYSENLHKYVLNYSSTFVGEETLEHNKLYSTSKDAALEYDCVNTDVHIDGDDTTPFTVLPWKVLLELSRKIAAERTKFKKEWFANPDSTNKTNEDFYAGLEQAVDGAIFGVWDATLNEGNGGYTKNPFVFECRAVKFDTNEPPTKIGYDDVKYAFGGHGNVTIEGEIYTSLNITDLANVLFMGPDQTCESQHKDENYNRVISFEESRGNTSYDQKTGTGIPKTDTSGKGQYGNREDGYVLDRDGHSTGVLSGIYGYSQVKYTLSSVYKIVEASDIVANKVIIENEDNQQPNRNFYAVNTNYVAMDNINISDGIQTLKEVAYILDIITDGWGNQYDPEGNGILLTYTIANNHDRIEDHEARLRELEGGKNIVKSIYREARSSSKFVNLHFESDTSWAWLTNMDWNNDVDITAAWNNNVPIEASKYYYGIYHEPHLKQSEIIDGSTRVCYAVPQSYIHSYIIRLQSYIAHRAEHTVDGDYLGPDLVAPKFADFYGFGPITPGERIVKTTGAGTEVDPIVNTYAAFVNEADGTIGTEALSESEVLARKPFEAFPITFMEVGFADGSGETKDSISYFKDLNGNKYDKTSGYWETPTYVGQVGIGIDLNVATTYTTAIFCENVNEKVGFVKGEDNAISYSAGFVASTPGFESIELNSVHINKDAIITVKLPVAISYTSIYKGGDVADEDSKDLYFDNWEGNGVTAPNVNVEHFRFTHLVDNPAYVDEETTPGVPKKIDAGEIHDLNIAFTSPITLVDNGLYAQVQTGENDGVPVIERKPLCDVINILSGNLLNKYSKDIENAISTINNLKTVKLVFEPKTETENTNKLTGAVISVKLNVHSDGTGGHVDYTDYRDQVFELQLLKDAVKEGEEVREFDVLAFVEVDYANQKWDSTNLPHNLYVRRTAKANVKQAYVDIDNENHDALTSVDWVTTYVSHVVDDVTRKLKSTEMESYQFTKSLFERLDSTYVTSYGMYVAGIKQENGIVTPIVRELPKDTISANTTVWGETNDDTSKQEYVAVTAAELLENEVAMDTPLFVINGHVYAEVDVYPNATFDLQPIGVNNALVIKKLDGADEAASEIDELVYTIDADGNYEVVIGDKIRKAKFSILAGLDYAHYIPCFIQRDKYVRIDGADLRKYHVDAVGEIPEHDKWQIELFDKVYSTDATDEVEPTYNAVNGTLDTAGSGKIYKSSAVKPDAKKEYISASVSYQADNTDGVGGNSFKVTAHITKISDATEANSGLVDAYDVKNTFDNMFEWIDLSRWDADGEGSPVNPVNTTALEAGGNVEAATNISKTKAAGNTQLGFPRGFYYDETSEDGRYKKDTTQGTPEELA